MLLEGIMLDFHLELVLEVEILRYKECVDYEYALN